MSQLVLSLFPGIGLLDMAFEQEGFVVVRGPDVLWGGDIRRFHPPAGKFDGVIGGPPCQLFSAMKRLNKSAGEKFGNLIPEFERACLESHPTWFLMENVSGAPEPIVTGYQVHSLMFNNRWTGAEQNRLRRFCFGTADGRRLFPETCVFENPRFSQAVTQRCGVPVKIGGNGKPKRTYSANGKRHGPNVGPRETIGRMLELQGFPPDMLDDCPYTQSGKRIAIGNGVPLPMGRAIAKAVKEATERTEAPQ